MLPTMFAPFPGSVARPSSRFLSFVVILLAHCALFYALQHGLMSKALQILPKETIVTLIQAPHTPPAPAKALPLPAKNLSQPATLPTIADLIVPAFSHVSEHAISVPSAPPVATGAPEPSMPAPAALPKQVSAVEYLQAPQADYPPLARRMGEEGKVVLRVLVNEQGRAENVEIQKSSGFNRLDDAARQALLRARFKPYVEDGKALMMLATATISFSLSS